MNQTDSPSDAVTDASHVAAAAGGENAVPALSLADINKTLGRNYKDVPTALAALQETYSYVGTQKQTAAVAPVHQGTVEAPQVSKADVDAIKNELFFARFPQYEGARSLIAKMGSNPSEVVETTEFKEVFEKVKVADDVLKQRSVVSSNSRVGQTKVATDNAVTVANATGSVDAVTKILAEAVVDSYSL